MFILHRYMEEFKDTPRYNIMPKCREGGTPKKVHRDVRNFFKNNTKFMVFTFLKVSLKVSFLKIYVFVFQVFHFLVREIAAETYFSVFFLHLLMKLEPKT